MADTVVDGVALKLSAELSEFEAGLDKAFRQVNSVAGKMEARFQHVGQAFKKVGKSMMTIGGTMLAAFTLPMAYVGKRMIDTASDAQEMRSMFNVVFDKSAKDVEKWAGRQGKAMGRSKLDLMNFAAQLQDTFKPAGFASEKAAELSKQVTELAVDLGSFKNMSDIEAFERLQGALIGNHENALKFGVTINETNLKQELMRIGAEKLTGAQLIQAKMQARLNILLRGTVDAHGDAERTSGSYANQVKRLNGRIKDLSAAFGEKFLPFATKVVEKLISLVEYFGGLDASTQGLIIAFAGVVAIIGPVTLALGAIVASVGVVAPALFTLATIIGKGLVAAIAGAQMALIRLAAMLVSPVAILGTLGAAFFMFRDTVNSAISETWDVIKSYLSDKWNNVVAHFRLGLDNLGRGWEKFKALFDSDVNVRDKKTLADFLPIGDDDDNSKSLEDAFRKTRENATREYAELQAHIEALKEKFPSFLPDIPSLGDVGDYIAKRLNLGQVDNFTPNGADETNKSVEETGKKVKSIFSVAAEGIRSDFENMSLDVRNIFGSLGSSIKNIFTNAINGILNNVVGSMMNSFGSSLFSGGLSGLFSFAGGGRLSAGMPTLVGERGPEMIVPDRTATVMNNHDSRGIMGGTTIQQHININNDLVPAPTIAAMIENAVVASVPAIKSAVLAEIARA